MTELVRDGHGGQVCGTDPLGSPDIRACDQDDERGGGTHDDRIDENAEGLNEPLGHGVRNSRGCSGVRGSALAGFVREEASLRAVDQGSEDATTEATDEGLGRECGGEDLAEDDSELADVHDDDDRNHDDVDRGHDRSHPFGHAGDGADTAEDDHGGEDEQQGADDDLRLGE